MQKNIVGNIFYEEFETTEKRDEALVKVLEEDADVLYFGLENDKYIYIIKKQLSSIEPLKN